MISCLSQKLGLGLITLIIHILPMMSQPEALSALCAHPHLSNSTPSFSLLHDLASSLVPTGVLMPSFHCLPISSSLPLSHASDSHPHAPYFHPYTLMHPFP